MKILYAALCAAVFAVGVATAEDVDVRSIQARLAANEARLNDIQAKMSGAAVDNAAVADGITTLRKNAVITIGGTVNTRYFYRSGTLKENNGWPGSSMTTIAKARGGDLFIADAKLEGKIDVNDHFDAYFKFDLQSSDSHSDNAEQYWVRWKNLCNSGFGVLVGRDELKYGMGPSVGVLDSWSAGSDTNGYGGMFDGMLAPSYYLGDYLTQGYPIPLHTGWDQSRVNQVTPYWENCDGTFKAELSFFQNIDIDGGYWQRTNWFSPGATKYRKNRNDGIGSMSARITWQPIEGLTLVASAINNHHKYVKTYWGDRGAKNNFAASLGFEYVPTFLCDRLTLWGYYQHGWNEGWVDDMDSDLVNAGVKVNFTDQFYGFVQGDYIYVKDDKAGLYWLQKGKGWAGYLGLGYVLPYGANFEVGYRHEKIDYKVPSGMKAMQYRADTVYGHVGFSF